MGILNSITKNPTVIGLAVLGVLAFVFRDKISSFASGVSGGAETVSNLGQTGNILSGNLLGSLEGIQDIFKGISDFKLPEITLPSFPSFDFNFEFPKFDFAPTPDTDFTSNPANENRANRSRDFTEVIKKFLPFPVLENQNVQSGLDTGQQFQGGGLSFIGGTINEIPIDRLSLSQIIDRFNVTASQASDIRARAQDDFGGFDFGTNTGGATLADLELPNAGEVSNAQFTGLSAEEIALRLTGGNINNF